MENLTAEELKMVVSAHREWFKSHGMSGARANLTDANLIGADLRDAKLDGVDE